MSSYCIALHLLNLKLLPDPTTTGLTVLLKEETDDGGADGDQSRRTLTWRSTGTCAGSCSRRMDSHLECLSALGIEMVVLTVPRADDHLPPPQTQRASFTFLMLHAQWTHKSQNWYLFDCWQLIRQYHIRMFCRMNLYFSSFLHSVGVDDGLLEADGDTKALVSFIGICTPAGRSWSQLCQQFMITKETNRSFVIHTNAWNRFGAVQVTLCTNEIFVFIRLFDSDLRACEPSYHRV